MTSGEFMPVLVIWAIVFAIYLGITKLGDLRGKTTHQFTSFLVGCMLVSLSFSLFENDNFMAFVLSGISMLFVAIGLILRKYGLAFKLLGIDLFGVSGYPALAVFGISISLLINMVSFGYRPELGGIQIGISIIVLSIMFFCIALTIDGLKGAMHIPAIFVTLIAAHVFLSLGWVVFLSQFVTPVNAIGGLFFISLAGIYASADVYIHRRFEGKASDLLVLMDVSFSATVMTTSVLVFLVQI